MDLFLVGVGGILAITAARIICVVLIIRDKSRRDKMRKCAQRIHEYANAITDDEQHKYKMNGYADVENEENNNATDVVAQNHAFMECMTQQQLAIQNDNQIRVLQSEEEQRRMSTGIEFGGYNTDPNLNPSHAIVDEMNDYNQQDWNDPFPDSGDNGWDNYGNYDSGFNDPFGF